MSVMKPGAISSVPPTAIIRPSATSLPGKRRSAKRLVEAPPGAATLVAKQQGAEQRVGEQQRQGRQHPDRLADLDDHVELRDRDDDEEARDDRSRWSCRKPRPDCLSARARRSGRGRGGGRLLELGQRRR